MENFRAAFYNGKENFSLGNFVEARKWFNISINSEEFMVESLVRLAHIDIKEGNYLKARKLLNDNKDIDDVGIKRLYGLLDNIENNFERSKKYYGECMIDDPKSQYTSLLTLSKLYIQTGDYEVARKMLETLQFNPKTFVQATYGLVSMNILEGNYKEAQRILRQVDISKLTPKLTQHYNTMDVYTKYHLNELEAQDKIIMNYSTYKLFDSSDRTLLEHIKKHLNQDERYSNGCFFKYMDLKKLLIDAKDIIEDMNATHFEISDMYRFRLDTPIGFKGDDITSDLCVVTMIGTKDIATMYPVLLSDEFDQEGMSTSKELKLKRERNLRK